MGEYGQFCPVAEAAEVVDERCTRLVRELVTDLRIAGPVGMERSTSPSDAAPRAQAAHRSRSRRS